jgi:hypothetical protein
MRQVSRMAAAAALVVSATVLATAPGSPAAAAPGPGTGNPYAPNYQHPYRHGAVPTRARLAQMRAYTAAHAQPAAAAASSDPLTFGGQVDGIGVTTGHEQVYLVFWGTQWGAQGSDANGDATFTGDPLRGAPRLQEMLKGLGTGGELWSGVMTQYCDEEVLGAGACLAIKPHVAYPDGGALAGVWYDNTSEPAVATPRQLGDEAVRAASHFGNTTPALNRNAQYVILSAPGLNPDNYLSSGFCAWHDWNGDSLVRSPSTVGDVAFTNMPYVMDAGRNCGQNFVNSGGGGTIDGYTLVEGHEYAETITDQNPRGGWTDPSGDENADKCVWIAPGGQGGAANVAMGNGSFPMQGTWSNDDGNCQISHPRPGLEIWTGLASRSTQVGTAVNLQLVAVGGIPPYRWSFSGLPTGLTGSTSGLVSGTLTALGTFNGSYSVTDSAGTVVPGGFVWTVTTTETRTFVGVGFGQKPPQALVAARNAVRSAITGAGWSLGDCEETGSEVTQEASGSYSAKITDTCTR